MGPIQKKKENSQQAGTNQDQWEEELARNLLTKFMHLYGRAVLLIYFHVENEEEEKEPFQPAQIYYHEP